MRIKIKKNHHYPFPFFFIPIPIWVSGKGKKIINRQYLFTKSSLFDLHNVDELDTNKLFGFSIGWHHHTSYRFGWRPSLSENKIEIIRYEYQDGQRIIIPICKVDINKLINFKLEYDPINCQLNYYVNQIMISGLVGNKRKGGLGYKLGLYFGGNEVAPQDIIIFKY